MPAPGRSELRQPADAGVVAVIVALTVSTVLLGMAAFAVDLGNALARRTNLQGIADDAARAGAGELPDTTLATAAAIRSLCAQPPDLTGWDFSGCPGGSPTVSTAGGPVAADITFDDDDQKDLGTPTPFATRITVRPPPVPVAFSFGAALGATGVDVNASATAKIGTPTGLGVLPFFLTPDDLAAPPAPGEFCLRFGNSRSPGPAGCGRNEARGVLSVPRFQGPSDQSATAKLNTLRGVEPRIQRWADWPVDSTPRVPSNLGSNEECPTDPTTVFAVDDPFEPDVNCLAVFREQRSSDSEGEGFFDSSGEPGRAKRICPGGVPGDIPTPRGTVTNVDVTSLFDAGSPLVNDVPATGTPAELLAALTTAGATPKPGWITSQIFSCPRFALLPVIDAQIAVPGGSKQYPVLDFRYVWIENITSAQHGFLFSGGGRLIGLQGYLIDPRYLPAHVVDSPTIGPYLGPGWPKQVVMVE